MESAALKGFAELSTALVADACVRSDVPVRVAPAGIGAVVPGHRVAGRALPARHYGSVDAFLEVLGRAEPGDVLVIDNGGRSDEACIGDLVVLEVEAAGLAGVVVWGLIGYARARGDWPAGVQLWQLPAGPTAADHQERDALESARFGPHVVSSEDVVFGDRDGVLFVAAEGVDTILATAREIWRTERDQASRIRQGEGLRRQTSFGDFLARRASDSSYTFRRHLRRIGGAVEE